MLCVHSHARFIEEASIENIRLLYASQKENIDDISDGVYIGRNVQSDSSKTTGTNFILPPTTIVSLPCCPTFRHVRDIGVPPDLKYDDDCVFSACRSVEVWNLEEEEVGENTQHDGEALYCSEDPSTLFLTNIPKQ